MGFVVWAWLTLCAIAAGYAVAARVASDRGFLERWIVTGLVCTLLVLAPVYVLAIAGVFVPWVVGPVSFVEFAAVAFVAVRNREGFARLQALWRSDVRAPLRLAREIFVQQELAAIVLVIALVALCVSTFIALRLPTWSWDCVWYHEPMTDYVVQSGALRWESTGIKYVNSYPRNVEMLSAWNVLFPRNSKLDDLTQIPFAVLGALVVAAFCRRFGVSRPFSASLGAMWITLPAVMLEIHTTHADVAAGALFIACFYFLSDRRFDAYARWMAMIALGLYVGTKVTGLFHAALLSPLIGFRFLVEAVRARGRRGRVIASIVASVICVALVGGYIYARNVVHTGNPLWPAKLHVPVLGDLPGELTVDQIAGPPAFFGAPGAFTKMIRQWFVRSENYLPDVKEGPFGVLFPFIALPAFLLIGATAVFSRERWQRLSLVLLFVLAVLVPAAWWGRFVLGAPAAALVCVGILHRELRFHLPRAVLSACAAFLSVASYAHATSGYRVMPSLEPTPSNEHQDQVRLRRELRWLWTPEQVRLRDSELHEGDVVTYDGSISFLGEYWTPDLRNRVEFLEHSGDDAKWWSELRALHPKWVSVRGGSRAEQLLRSKPHAFQPLFRVPMCEGVMYRVVAREF